MANPNKSEQSRTGEKPSNPDQPKAPQSTGNPSGSRLGNQPGSSSASTGENDSYSFRCADAGFNDCKWETKGATPDEVLHKAEQHGREQHHLTNINEEMRNKVKSNIHKAA